MNISIYLPVILVQIFLWLCVACSCFGVLLLIGGWLMSLVRGRKFYWLAVTILSMRAVKIHNWSYGMFSTMAKQLKKENHELFKGVSKLFNDLNEL